MVPLHHATTGSKKGVRRGGQGARKKGKVGAFDASVLKWSTPATARKSMETLMQQLPAGGISGRDFRTLTYGLRALVRIWEVERRTEMEAKVAEILAFIEELKKGKPDAK